VRGKGGGVGTKITRLKDNQNLSTHLWRVNLGTEGGCKSGGTSQGETETLRYEGLSY